MIKPGTDPRRCITFIVILLLLQGKLFSQLSANFSANPVSGCSPVVVQFTDQSTGGPAQWRWDLGNGVTSFLQNPSSSYFNPGTYNIKLVVRNAGGADSIVKNQFITVYANPVVSFAASDSAGCFPLPVQFTDLSIPGSGTIVSRSWDFGDGTTSTLQSPLHVYTSAGSFTVTLRVINSSGCTKTFSKTQYIQTTDGVTADFTNSNPGSCSAPITINFTNTSTGPGVLTYTWDFGDGAGSNSKDPVHTYTNAGSYTVTLVTVSPQGCSDTMRKINHISIGIISSQFSSPATICEGKPFNITNTTTPAPGSVLWNFGDGTTSTDINPVKTYTAGGTFTIKLVNNFGGCMDSVSHSILVNPKPAAAFTSNQTALCQVPAAVSFTNQSTGAITYLWNFGDGGSSTDKDPLHTYTTTGNYTVTLIATNLSGCSDTLVKTEYIKIQKPTIAINGLPRMGCNPLTINPAATVTANQPIATYLWSFGDGATSNLTNPLHTYTTAGTYNVSLTITTVGGCTETVVMNDAVKVGDKPNADFTANPTDVCALTPVNFTDQSTGNVDQWFWQFGDGGTSTGQNPSYVYSDTGYFSVTLIVWSNGCADTLRVNNMIHIRPPIAKFITGNNCVDKYNRDFVDQSIGAEGWFWNFGDGNTSSAQNPSHTFTVPGSYTVSLTITNGTCSNSIVQTIKVVDEKADFNADKTEFCKGTAANFTTININTANVAVWQWDFGDGTSANTPGSASHVYNTTGLFTVSLTITDILGCVSVETMTVNVYGPAAAFTSNMAGACLGQSTIQFTDTSATDGTHALVKWIWNYGDGAIDSTSPPPYSHFYTTAGEYDVSLSVVDNFGCPDKITKPAGIIIAQPHADFNSPDTISCTDKPIQFNNASTGYDLQYSWTFGDGANSAAINPVHNYSNVGLYSVNLLVTDRYGCKDSLDKQDYINISFPKAEFTISDSLGTCPPLLVNFTNTSLDYTNVSWNFGDGNTSVLNDPSHYYTIPGIYYAKLIVTGPGGCTDTVSKKIEIRGPKGSFTYAPQIGCDPLTVGFTATTSNRVSFLWDFSDGNTLSTTDSIVTHTYTAPGEYTPKMIISDASGCTVPIVGSDIIKVVGINAVFSADQFQFCDSGYVNLFNTSVSNDLITDYQWSFGDGNFSNSQQPSHHYTTAGIYDIQLTVTTQTGCTDTYVLSDTVKVFESPVIKILGDSSACVPAQLTFSGEVSRGNINVLAWQWNFSNGQVSALQNPAVQMFTNAGAYNVSFAATDDHGCKDSVIKTVTIHPLPNTNAGADALACRDIPLQLNATGAASYVWDASPSLSCTDCAGPLAIPADSTTYIVTGVTSFGCTQKDSVLVRVRQKFTLIVSPDDSICVGNFIRLSATGTDQYRWSPSTGLDNPNIATPKASPTQTTTYTVTANDNDNCFTKTAMVTVKVHPIPTVEAGPDITIPVGSAGQLNAIGSADVIKWKWAPEYNLSCFNCPDPKAAPKQTTKYSVEVKNNGGCSSNDHLTVFVVCKGGNLFIPNTFSPNGDGANDKFYPRGTGIALIKSFRVFDRWGEVVYERINFSANDASAGWDGTYKGQKLATDVYVYSCEVVCENNETLSFKGDVTLLR